MSKITHDEAAKEILCANAQSASMLARYIAQQRDADVYAVDVLSENQEKDDIYFDATVLLKPGQSLVIIEASKPTEPTP